MKGYRIVLLALGLLLLFGVSAAPVLACDDCCCDPKTPGYWKTHADAWPAEGLCIGGTWYDKEDIIPMLSQVSGDKSYTLFRAYVAAVLNVKSGCCPPCCVADAICAAETWLACHPAGSGVAASSCDWKYAECLYWKLDWWNNT